MLCKKFVFSEMFSSHPDEEGAMEGRTLTNDAHLAIETLSLFRPQELMINCICGIEGSYHTLLILWHTCCQQWHSPNRYTVPS